MSEIIIMAEDWIFPETLVLGLRCCQAEKANLNEEDFFHVEIYLLIHF